MRLSQDANQSNRTASQLHRVVAAHQPPELREQFLVRLRQLQRADVQLDLLLKLLQARQAVVEDVAQLREWAAG
jgi:hypothetical protein